MSYSECSLHLALLAQSVCHDLSNCKSVKMFADNNGECQNKRGRIICLTIPRGSLLETYYVVPFLADLAFES